jgi:tetratricopeptide (TPR) repeat protein
VEDYRDRIDRAQKDNKYAEYLASATAQMDRGDYQAALVSVNHARKLRNGREVDDMEKRIEDRRARDEWIASGNRAMTDGDFSVAAEHYRKANMLEASPIIERAAKQANAMVLVREADAELKAGNILKAQQLLKNSVWSCPTPAATSMLDGIGEAVAAAEQERQADQDIDRGQFDDGIAKYERALPKLPAPADARVREKLANAQRARVVAKADELFQARKYQDALNGYLEAQKMGKEDPDITAKIEKARQRLKG